MSDQSSEGPYSGRGLTSPRWWPSRYGSDDDLGAGNELTSERVVAALQLPRSGEVIELGQVLEAGVPAFPPRGWNQLILSHETLEEKLSAPAGTRPTEFEEHVDQAYHIGTHLDALGHMGISGRFYNGRPYGEMYEVTGLTQLGIERVKPWIARGVCLDIAGLEGCDVLPDSFEILPTHLDAACEKQGVTIHPGDVVLLHTGWATLWMVDNDRYGSAEPGVGWDGAHWLTDRRVSLVGADNWALEVWPPKDPDDLLIVHQHLLVETGTYIIENLRTVELAKRGVSEFLFLLTPAKTRGSTACMAGPVAVL
jgi:kynurenine formamidase